jgi:hypothetical protein
MNPEMTRALSIADAVVRRGCDFTGCETCPFSVYARSHHGCIHNVGASWLSVLPFLAALLGQDDARANELVNTDLERAIDVDRGEYSVASVEQTRELARRLHDALRGLEDIVEGPEAEIRPEWVERARAELEPWIDPWADPRGHGPKLSLLRDMLTIVAEFLDSAVALGAEVELGRYLDLPIHSE